MERSRGELWLGSGLPVCRATKSPSIAITRSSCCGIPPVAHSLWSVEEPTHPSPPLSLRFVCVWRVGRTTSEASCVMDKVVFIHMWSLVAGGKIQRFGNRSWLNTCFSGTRKTARAENCLGVEDETGFSRTNPHQSGRVGHKSRAPLFVSNPPLPPFRHPGLLSISSAVLPARYPDLVSCLLFLWAMIDLAVRDRVVRCHSVTGACLYCSCLCASCLWVRDVATLAVVLDVILLLVVGIEVSDE